MSVADGLPGATAGAIGVAAVVGVLGLAIHDSLAGAGAVAGVVLGAAVLRIGRSVRGSTLGATLLAVGAFGAVATAVVGFRAGARSFVLAAAAVVVGAAVAVAVSGGATAVRGRQVRSATLAVAAVGALAAALSLLGGLYGDVATDLWFRVAGFGALLAVAGVAVVLGVLSLPSAAFATPRTRESALRARNGLAVIVAVGTVLGFVLLAAASPAAVTLAGVSLADATAAWPVRALVGVVAALGLGLAAFGVAVRLLWDQTSFGDAGTAGVVLGGAAGVGVVSLVATAAGRLGGPTLPVVAATGATALLLGAAWALGPLYAQLRRNGPLPGAGGLIAVGLVGGVVAAEGLGSATVGPGSLGSLVAIGAGLFAYEAARYGRVLAREVGPADAERGQQLLRLGWSGSVATVGVVVAGAGLGATTLVAPVFSVPATAGVLAGVIALGAGAWLLLR